VITGIWADTFDQHAFVANLLITPLALLGGVLYAARRLDEPWQTLTHLDPLFYLVDATREGYAAVHETVVAVSLAVALATTAGTVAAAIALMTRGYRLKPPAETARNL
jgi:ABC-2 type transport system permease protein